MTIFLILLGILAVIFIWFLGTYNQFVTIKARIKASTQEIGNQLKRQADLIPNLVASVKGYMKHEKEIFQDLTDARKTVMNALGGRDLQKMIDASAKMQQALAPIMALVESTPQLQAAGPTGKLMDELRDTADKLMYARRTLIDLTADYNIMTVRIPSNIVASIFNFKELPGLQMPEASESALSVTPEEMKNPKVNL